MVTTKLAVRETHPALLTVKEVAAMLRMSEAFVRKHSNGRRQPTIPSLKLGKAVRFRREAVLEFIRDVERWGKENCA